MKITHNDELHLTEYLINRVTASISGRDGEDLVDVVPSRSIFAGVLQPPKESDIKAAHSGETRSEAPSGTALGLDFRLVPDTLGQPIRLRITVKWSHYYAVFPTWIQAVQANRSLFETVPPKPEQETPLIDTLETIITSDAPVESDEPIPTADAPVEADEDLEDEQIVHSGRVMLPRVFRRYEVQPATFAVDLPLDRSERLLVGNVEIGAAIEQARTAMMSDQDAWRHLDEPRERQRSIGEAQILKSKQTYEQALSAVRGAAVALPAWLASLQVETQRDLIAPDTLRVRMLLANGTQDRDEKVEDPGLEERSLFDASIAVEIDGGQLVPFDFLLAPKDYRSQAQMPAKGINCTAAWDSSAPHRLATETLPIFRQPLYRTKESMEVSFESLDTVDPTPKLEQIADQMLEYLETWNRFLELEGQRSLTLDELNACQTDRDSFAAEIKRYQLGIETLRRDPALAKAFQYMNRTFFQIAEASGGRITAWRLFQIGFIVSQLPSLAVRELDAKADDEYAQELRRAFEEVGVLWFPTGGGKTEAYLGFIATALLYDRLRGKTRGICAWMRFPLRMLSLQQLERLARVIAALNRLRDTEPPLRVGDPFAIGYYVGDGVTPNSMSDENMKRYQQDEGSRNGVLLLRKCPFCGSNVHIEPLTTSWRLAHVCSNTSCFSNTSNSLGVYKGSLPLCIVDNEIYRYLPSVLVGTVDKLAIVGRNRHFAHLMRGVKQQCPEHGYTSYDECIERWGAGCKSTKKVLGKLTPVKDPGPSLLIQDELHLLRAELGVFNGHYEGLLRYLGDRAHLAPKVLAATATIEAYDTHAFHIYLSRSRRYPQPAWKQGESFYATSTPRIDRRIYVGVLGHSRGIEEPTLRLLGLYWREVRRLISNPRHAAVIMNREDVSDEVILDTLRLYDLSLTYVSRKATGGSIIDKLPQAERLLIPEKLGTLQSKFLTGDQRMEEVGATIERIERERNETGEPRLDVVVATNLISHGVDLERINMMTVAGMPSHYAEYVQATSRAARSHPDIVFVCFKGRDPRESSQYEFFPAMHEHMDRLIEAVAVNRFATFAPDKTVPGLLAGVLLCDLTPDLYGSKISKPLDDIPTLQVALGLKPASASGTQANCLDQVAIRNSIAKIIGVDRPHPPASPAQTETVRKRVEVVVDEQLEAIGRTFERQLKHVLNPITSFRDVDEGIDFGSIDSADLVTRLRSR